MKWQELPRDKPPAVVPGQGLSSDKDRGSGGFYDGSEGVGGNESTDTDASKSKGSPKKKKRKRKPNKRKTQVIQDIYKDNQKGTSDLKEKKQKSINGT